MKKLHLLNKMVNPQIKIGDYVKLNDGSALTIHENHKEYIDKELSIVNSYFDITKTTSTLRNLVFEVVETSCFNSVCLSNIANLSINVYLQDIIVSYNNIKFRTCSKFVEKTNYCSTQNLVIGEIIKVSQPDFNYGNPDIIARVYNGFVSLLDFNNTWSTSLNVYGVKLQKGEKVVINI